MGSTQSGVGNRSRPAFQPLDPAGVASRLATELIGLEVTGRALRVAVDGPRVADPSGFAEALVVPLRALGRPVTHIRAETFWRDAALRLEYGHTDLESFATGWLDVDALRREVLDPLEPGGTGEFLPSLRDPVSNRATRAPVRAAEPGLVVLLSGGLLLGRGLPIDWSIHLAVSSAARRRRTPKEWQWSLPAFDDYDAEIDPLRTADVVLRYDDPRHPALRVSTTATSDGDLTRSD